MIHYETDRLILRNWQDTDIDAFIKLGQDSKVMEFYPRCYTPEESVEIINKYKKSMLENGFSMYACELKDPQQLIGYTGLMPRNDLPFSPCVEIGWRIFSDYWGNGFAVEGAKKCLDIGFNGFNLDEIVSFTANVNYRSERVMQKLGMISKHSEDFNHPKLPKDHPLSLHVLYRLNKNEFQNKCKDSLDSK